jgi:hypothetical protein
MDGITTFTIKIMYLTFLSPSTNPPALSEALLKTPATKSTSCSHASPFPLLIVPIPWASSRKNDSDRLVLIKLNP